MHVIVLGIDPGVANTGYGVVAHHRGRLVALDGGQPQAGVLPGGGLDHPAVQRHQTAAVVRDDAVAGVGHPRIDAEDDHVHERDSARRPGRLPRRLEQSG